MERECTECGKELAEDECFDGGICGNCYEKDVEEHEADLEDFYNAPIIPQRFVY